MSELELCYGFISEYNPEDGLVRVEIAEDDDNADTETKLVTPLIPFVVPKALNTKFTLPFDINEQVAVVMDWENERGVVLGAVYNNQDKPDGAGVDIFRILFSNGSSWQFDRSNGTMATDIEGMLTLKSADKVQINDGDNGGIPNSADIADKLNAIENDLNTLKQLWQTVTPVAQDGGAAIKAFMATWAGQSLNVTTPVELEDDKATH